jgi:hypothetical protein
MPLSLPNISASQGRLFTSGPAKGSKYNVKSLADQSKAPHHKRNWEVTLIQEERIRRLRKRYPYYDKKKSFMRKNIPRRSPPGKSRG